MVQNIELLAPAGSYEGLVQAIEAGADAVYCGGKLFGARAYAENFTQEELIRAIDYVHLHGKVLFLTVNTLVKESEFQKDLYAYLKPLYEAGLDGVIVQDMGVIDLIKHVFPHMEVHTSTQLTVTSPEGVSYLRDLGADRVVLARELSLSEIRRITSDCGVDIECFVHGALCYCYSGQCLLSSILGGRSGNRGRCAQPCRLPYKDENGKQAYYLSLRDLCTIDHIPELIESGIKSFKIEGRMKKPEYTAGVTAIYRKYIDLYLTLKEEGREAAFQVEENDRRILHELYSRTKSGSGYYFRRNSRKMLTLDKPGYLSDSKAAKLAAPSVVPDLKLKLNGKLILSQGETGKLYLTFGELSTYAETEEVITEAVNQPVTEEQVSARMRKTGNTPFAFTDLDVEIHGSVYVPVKALNELRREALAAMESQILQSFKRTADAELLAGYMASLNNGNLKQDASDASFGHFREQKQSLSYTASVRTIDQLKTAQKYPILTTLYLEPSVWMHMEEQALKKLSERIHREERRLFFAFPHILRADGMEKLRACKERVTSYADGVLIRNMESLAFIKEIRFTGQKAADSNCYSYNRASHAFWSTQCDYDTIPVELNEKEIRRRGTEDSELIVYGYLPLMLTAQCLQQTFNGCTRASGTRQITDRYNKTFTAVQVCDFCYNILLNSLPIHLLDETAAITKTGCRSLRLSFTIENAARTQAVLDSLSKNEPLKGEFTRGHFHRGVE